MTVNQPYLPAERCSREVMALDAGKDLQAHFTALARLVEEQPDDPLILWMAAVQISRMRPGYHTPNLMTTRPLSTLRDFTVPRRRACLGSFGLRR